MGLSLVTKAEYKAYAGLTSPAEDVKIDSLIPKVSELVKNICRRTFVDFVDEAKVEYLEGGDTQLNLAEYPVIAVTSVERSTDLGNTYTAMQEYVDYAYNRKSESVASTVNWFPYYINGYRVTYIAGYEVIPQDLKLAIFDLISYYLKNDSAIHSSKAPGTNSVQIEYVTTTKLPAHISRVLDLYTANYA